MNEDRMTKGSPTPTRGPPINRPVAAFRPARCPRIDPDQMWGHPCFRLMDAEVREAMARTVRRNRFTGLENVEAIQRDSRRR